MIDVKDLFKSIGRDDIDENMKNLVSSGIIDSMDIMSIVEEIEQAYKMPLNAKYIDIDNFESFNAVENMIKEAFKR